MFEPDPLAVLAREVLRERRAALIAETCAWAVGMSDRPHHLRRQGRLVATGGTVGERAAAGLPLSDDEAGRLDLGDARPGSFQDGLNALRPDGTLYADAFDDEVLDGFVRETCVLAAERLRKIRPAAWRALLDDLGEDETADLADIVRAGEWEAPLRIDAEHLVLAGLGSAPLLEVEAEGLPLSAVRAAEAVTRAAEAATRTATPAAAADQLDGAVFLAEAGVRDAGLSVPVPPAQAGRLLAVLLEQGLEPEEVGPVLARLPVEPDAAEKVLALLADAG